MKIKKYISSLAVIALILISSIVVSTKVFAVTTSMPNGTVVIGSKAYDLVYANDSKNLDEITNTVVAGGTVCIKNFNGVWIDNNTSNPVATSTIPRVTYKNKDGIETLYKAGDILDESGQLPVTPSQSLFTRSDISTICNYSDLLVSDTDITLKDYDDFGKTTVKPTYAIPTAYMPNLKANVYAIANSIIKDQTYTTIGYGDAKKRLNYYDRVVISNSQNSDYFHNYAFIYALYTDNAPYIDAQKVPHYAGLKPIGESYLGTGLLDPNAINSFYKTNKILFGDQGNNISDEIVTNYKIHANDVKQFSCVKICGNIKVQEIYMSGNILISFFEII